MWSGQAAVCSTIGSASAASHTIGAARSYIVAAGGVAGRRPTELRTCGQRACVAFVPRQGLIIVLTRYFIINGTTHTQAHAQRSQRGISEGWRGVSEGALSQTQSLPLSTLRRLSRALSVCCIIQLYSSRVAPIAAFSGWVATNGATWGCGAGLWERWRERGDGCGGAQTTIDAPCSVRCISEARNRKLIRMPRRSTV